MKKILLIITGGIASYRALDLIREIKRSGDDVTCVMTKSACEFVQPISFATLSKNKVYTELFDLNNESEIGHINLSREADLIVIVPATANTIYKIANGVADDLASTIMLASNKPTLIAPSMNVKMWENQNTVANILKLKEQGIKFVGPNKGEMACGEVGYGKMASVDEIKKEIDFLLKPGLLNGKRALVTSGPTIEKIDPVRFLSNRSSGKQGHAIANALRRHGADTNLISGPVNIKDPENVKVTNINSAEEMLQECRKNLPVDIAIFAAAVSDWKCSETSNTKIKKTSEGDHLTINLQQNQDILKEISTLNNNRPKLVIGFSLETDNLIEAAKEKLKNKSCDWIIANGHHNGEESVFDSEMNSVKLIDNNNVEDWGYLNKNDIAEKICLKISKFFNEAA
ncbi:MAG: bifunctional phosphopantothenoylcysteine decarboxylase/phosphopantothenate--cysteine ligase CoaBC [Pseudomonadota bacterium]|nr:bifunctional phosphopantothenoylcysteine decarboxylase/phosphopantothenate--cysteine ligase CoaBC [Pseudomonadota bacterium]MEC9392464.1 bifunctional phosphopantothenoylcysteine decarboxylase/phosphopantothenate--cysteine ligase CoaBC [Pseudomonadota bacterium]MEC9459097.1 bifunctional phosphopantothenoylcysteine decarboxylase/phosphopantothenate--cysteine ligase CoaBC [Pseudomonadota bacterium]MEC9481604.1 bifunctional phosphopantothenoylcysteine decarboxylase/phosphopantothenate--cysteine l